MSAVPRRKNLYLIAGPNGSGKTTFARQFLPQYVHCPHFVNPDLIAQGLSPFDPRHAMVRAGRLVVEQIRAHMAAGEEFAFESTLAGLAHRRTLQTARQRGYRVHVFFLWVSSCQLALQRIADRVAEGGHAVAASDVRRRYARSLRNLTTAYARLADSLFFFDNSGIRPVLVFKAEGARRTVYDQNRYASVMKGSQR